MKVYQHIAGLLQAIENCRASNNDEQQARHDATLATLLHERMPSGGGFDNGTHLDGYTLAGRTEKLVFSTSFHHMDENGCYCGWTSHLVTVRPSLNNTILISISGRNWHDIKELIHETFYNALMSEVD